MDANSVISLLNFSKTLIQNGEISLLFYERFPKPPDEKGKRLRDIIAFREQELRDADKDEDPAAYRRAILENLEAERKYEPFRDSDAFFHFAEVSIVFQNSDDYAHNELIDYWMAVTSRFENHPSLGSIRFFNAGYEYMFLGNGAETLTVIRASQFDHTRNVSGIEKKYNESTISPVFFSVEVPPTHFIDETRAEVESTTFEGETGYIITHFPFKDDEEVLSKVYIRLSPLPEVFREDYYFQSESPNANADGYWIRVRTDYSDFEQVEALTLAVPKVRVHTEFRPDGWMHRQTIYNLREMDFNLELPMHFFEWQETDLDDEKGNRKEIREMRKE